jgi:hypothetical protein
VIIFLSAAQVIINQLYLLLTERPFTYRTVDYIDLVLIVTAFYSWWHYDDESKDIEMLMTVVVEDDEPLTFYVANMFYKSKIDKSYLFNY